ncbi:MAG: hypothetical protein MJ252_01995, partial [archaeon]|nr:hypothetical protein [archaeon]
MPSLLSMPLKEKEDILLKIFSKEKGGYSQRECVINTNRNILNLLSERQEIDENESLKNLLCLAEQFQEGNNIFSKLEQIFSYFFDNSNLMMAIKKLTWSLYIFYKAKLLPGTKGLLTKYQFLNKILVEILLLIPNDLYPDEVEIDEKNKLEKVLKTISSRTKYNMTECDYESTIGEIRTLLKEKLSKVDFFKEKSVIELFNEVNELYSKLIQSYKEEKPNENSDFFIYDERIHTLSFLMKEFRSPRRRKYSNFLTQEITCKKQLDFNLPTKESNFLEPEQTDKNQSKTFGSPMFSKGGTTPFALMTPITRTLTLVNWGTEYVKDFDIKEILEWQKSFKPGEEYKYNSELFPIDSYIKTQISKLRKISKKERFEIKTKDEVILKLCLKLIQSLICKEKATYTMKFCCLLLFNEEFIKDMIIIAFELVLSSEDIQELPIDRMLKEFNVSVFSFWKILRSIQYPTITFHRELYEHLWEIENQIITFLIWYNPEDIFKEELKDYLNKPTDVLDTDKKISSDEIMEDSNEKTKIKNDSIIDKNFLNTFDYTKQSLIVFHKKEDFIVGAPIFNFEVPEEIQSLSLSPNFTKTVYVKEYISYLSAYNFIRNIMTYSITLTKQIFKILPCKEAPLNYVESLLKKIFTSIDLIEIVYNHHLDQIIICCIICVLSKLFSFIGKGEEELYSDSSDNISKEEINKKVSYEQLREAYLNSKKLQIKLVSDSIFDKVRTKKGQFETLYDFYNKIFAVSFTEITDNIIVSNIDENYWAPTPTKKRKLSDSITFNQHSEFDNFQPKSGPHFKKNSFDSTQFLRTENTFGVFNYNENKPKRFTKTKSLFYLIMKSEEGFLSKNSGNLQGFTPENSLENFLKSKSFPFDLNNINNIFSKKNNERETVLPYNIQVKSNLFSETTTVPNIPLDMFGLSKNNTFKIGTPSKNKKNTPSKKSNKSHKNTPSKSHKNTPSKDKAKQGETKSK